MAVVAHADKTFGDRLPDPRNALAPYEVDDPPRVNIPKSKKVPPQVGARSTRASAQHRSGTGALPVRPRGEVRAEPEAVTICSPDPA